MIIRSQNPLVRIASLALGIVLLGVLFFFGLLVAGALLVGACAVLVWRGWIRIRAKPGTPAAAGAQPHAPEPKILEGEFTVVHDEDPPPH